MDNVKRSTLFPAEPADTPREWKEVGLSVAVQPFHWSVGYDRSWKYAALNIGPIRLSLQFP